MKSISTLILFVFLSSNSYSIEVSCSSPEYKLNISGNKKIKVELVDKGMIKEYEKIANGNQALLEALMRAHSNQNQNILKGSCDLMKKCSIEKNSTNDINSISCSGKKGKIKYDLLVSEINGEIKLSCVQTSKGFRGEGGEVLGTVSEVECSHDQ